MIPVSQCDVPTTKAKAGYAALTDIWTLRVSEAQVLLTVCGSALVPHVLFCGTHQSHSYPQTGMYSKAGKWDVA